MINATTRDSITVAGPLSDNGDCSGTSYKTNNHEYKNVIVTAKLEIDIYTYMATANREKNQIILRSGSHCSYKEGQCIDSDSRRVF